MPRDDTTCGETLDERLVYTGTHIPGPLRDVIVLGLTSGKPPAGNKWYPRDHNGVWALGWSEDAWIQRIARWRYATGHDRDHE